MKYHLLIVLSYDNVGNYTQTLRYYQQALEAARKCNNHQWTVQTLNNIAMTFDMIGEKDSLKYYIDQAKPYASKDFDNAIKRMARS